MGSKTYISTLARGALLLLPFLSGCSMGTDLGRPEWARVVLSASSTLSVELLISQKFLVTGQSVQLMEFTTEAIAVPFDQKYTLGAPARFFIRITNTAEEAISFHFKVFLEESTWVDGDHVLPPGEAVEFVYRYDEPVFY